MSQIITGLTQKQLSHALASIIPSENMANLSNIYLANDCSTEYSCFKHGISKDSSEQPNLHMTSQKAQVSNLIYTEQKFRPWQDKLNLVNLL
jgi:hypothetical protein